MYNVIFIDLNLMYMLMYGKVFKTPELFRSAVRETLTTLGCGGGKPGSLPSAVEANVLKRQFRYIPSMGIKV